MLNVLSRLPRDIYDVTATCYTNQYVPEVVQAYEAAGIKTALFSKAEGLSLALDLARFIRRGRFDIVHTHYHWENLWARLAALLVGVPIVMTYQHTWPEREKERHRIAFRLLNRWTYCNVTISEALRRYNIERVGIPPRKVVTVHNGIDTAAFRPPSPEQRVRMKQALGLPATATVIGAAGRLVDWKRFDLFLQGAAIVQRGAPDVRFLVVGGGPMRESLIDLAGELNLQESVRFLGWQADMPFVYQAMDIFCLTSDSGPNSINAHGGEGFGLVSAEAMSSGLPVVAVDTEVNREVIGEDCGLFCRPEADDLAEKICRLLADPLLRAKLSRTGLVRAEQSFNIDRTAAQLSDIYLRAVEEMAPQLGRRVRCA